MKRYRIFISAAFIFCCLGTTYAQTAGEVIDKYLNSLGGKEKISAIKSLYTESKMEVMGMGGITRTTILNGKGMRQETDIMGNTSVTCLTDKGGWSVNPMTGSTTAADMPAEVFNAMKSQLVIGAPFIQYQANGIKADLDGTEVIGDVKAIKIKLTEADNSTSTYFFDPNTFSMIRSVKKMQMRGQEAEIAVDFSNFNKAGDFYVIPFKSEMAMGNGMKMVNTVTKAEIDKAVDMAIFNKP
jgi:hypothetical protein